MKPIIQIGMVGFLCFGLSGCSAGDFLAQYARSDIEKAAESQLESDVKLQQLVYRQKDYELHVKLMPITTGAGGVVFVYRRMENEETITRLEGFMSKPTEGTYHLWFTNESQDKFVDAGEIIFEENERVYLEHRTKEEVGIMTTMILSLELEEKSRPQTPLLAGILISSAR